MRVKKASAKCHGCGKKGHFKSECRSLNRSNDRQTGSSRSRKVGSKQKANKATKAIGPDWGLSATHEPDGESESEGNEAAALVASADGWILDSGASSHFVSDKSRLENYEPYVIQVKVADQQIVHTVGRGKLRVRSIVKCVQHNITFSNVLYVPNFANLISVGRLTHLGADIRFSKHLCSIVMEGQTILEATRFRQNLWRLQFDYVEPKKQMSAETVHLASSTDKTQTLHRRLGHPSVKSMEQLVKDQILPPITPGEFEEFRNRTCLPCIQGKQHRAPLPTGTTKVTVPLARVHSDLAGPKPVQSFSGKRYMMTIWDEATSFLWTYPIEQKSDAFEIFVQWQAQVERETGKKVKTLRMDNGGEYTSNTCKTYLRTLGIRAETTIPHTPQQNGKSERGNRTIEEKVTCLLQDANGIDDSERGRYWAETLNTATYLINRLPTSSNNGKTRYEAYYGSRPSLHHVRTFGSKAYVYDRTHNNHQSKTIECILLGYGDDQFGKKAYRLKTKSDGRILFSRDVQIDETPNNRPRQVTLDVTPFATDTITGTGGESELEDMERKQSPESKQPSEEREITAQQQENILDQLDSLPQAQEEPFPAPVPSAPDNESLTRPRREIRRPGEYWKLPSKGEKDAPKRKPFTANVEIANFVALGPLRTPSVDALNDGKKIPIPETFHEAVTSEYAAYWKTAMDEEMLSFEANGVFELTELPESRKTVGG